MVGLRALKCVGTLLGQISSGGYCCGAARCTRSGMGPRSPARTRLRRWTRNAKPCPGGAPRTRR
eukprot:8401247-Alexandrium_andersonii.AAC.1